MRPHIPSPRIDPTATISPGATVYGDVEIGARSLLLFGAVVRAELDIITIGSETNIQDNAILHCDKDLPCLIGNRVTVAHSAVVHGATVGDRALVGIGAMALNGSVVGEGAWLGAGSVLAEGNAVPPWSLALGAPARVVRDLTEVEIARADNGVTHYLDLATVYREIFEKQGELG